LTAWSLPYIHFISEIRLHFLGVVLNGELVVAAGAHVLVCVCTRPVASVLYGWRLPAILHVIYN